jgi:hypothetical protein
MKFIRVCNYGFVSILLVILPVHAQNITTDHWGIQGDVAAMNLPKFAVEQIHALVEKPQISGDTYGVGLVRFNKKGAPAFALQFCSLRVSMNGILQQGLLQGAITGTGIVRGFMATKYVNFVTRKYVSGGLAIGGGLGKLEAGYTRLDIFQGVSRLIDSGTYNRPVPLFEILGRVDVRPVKYITVGPYYGIRNGTLALGAAVRLHITK